MVGEVTPRGPPCAGTLDGHVGDEAALLRVRDVEPERRVGFERPMAPSVIREDVDAHQPTTEARDHLPGETRHGRRRLVDARVDRPVRHELPGVARLLVRERDAVRRREQAHAGGLCDPFLQQGRTAHLATARLVLAPRRLDAARLVEGGDERDVAGAVAEGGLEDHGLPPGTGQAPSRSARSQVRGCGIPCAAHTAWVTSLSDEATSAPTGIEQRDAGRFQERSHAKGRRARDHFLHEDVRDRELPARGGRSRGAPAGATPCTRSTSTPRSRSAPIHASA
jgi:hypothetical protein